MSIASGVLSRRIALIRGNRSAKTARVPFARLDRIEGNFEHDVRRHLEITSAIVRGVTAEMLRQFRDLHIGETAVGFADREQFPGRLVAHRKGVIAQHMIAFPVPEFHRDHDHIERRQFLLQLEPRHAAAARRVLALRVFDHKTFVQTAARLLEAGLDLLRGFCGENFGDLELLRERELTQEFAPFAE